MSYLNKTNEYDYFIQQNKKISISSHVLAVLWLPFLMIQDALYYFAYAFVRGIAGSITPKLTNEIFKSLQTDYRIFNFIIFLFSPALAIFHPLFTIVNLFKTAVMHLIKDNGDPVNNKKNQKNNNDISLQVAYKENEIENFISNVFTPKAYQILMQKHGIITKIIPIKRKIPRENVMIFSLKFIFNSNISHENIKYLAAQIELICRPFANEEFTKQNPLEDIYLKVTDNSIKFTPITAKFLDAIIESLPGLATKISVSSTPTRITHSTSSIITDIDFYDQADIREQKSHHVIENNTTSVIQSDDSKERYNKFKSTVELKSRALLKDVFAIAGLAQGMNPKQYEKEAWKELDDLPKCFGHDPSNNKDIDRIATRISKDFATSEAIILSR